MKNKNVKDEKKEKKIGLTTKIFIALLLGAVFGIVLCYLIPDSKVKNEKLFRLLQERINMTLLPLID